MTLAPRPPVSVVVTAYNHERFLAASLDSVLEQGIDAIDIVVVDDGSDDGTLAMARSYEDRGVRVVAKANGGPSSAVNAGIAQARGEVVVLFSGDDLLLPNSIAVRLEALALTGADIVSAAPVWVNDEGRELMPAEYPPVFQSPADLRPVEMFSRLYYHGNFICAPSVAVRRSCLEAVGPFNELLWQLQDYEYWLRAAAKGFGFHFLQQPLIRYRMHARNLSTANEDRLFQETELVLARASGWLGAADLRELLFGRGLRDVDTGIDAAVLAQMLTVRHWRTNVSTIGGWELGKRLEAPDASLAVHQRLSCGIELFSF